MVSDFSDSLELLHAAVGEKQYPGLIAQLSKDFSRANVSIDISEGLNPKELHGVLREKVYYLILEAFPDYLNLMYFVDVPEKAFRELIFTDVVEVADQVVFLILRREMQKLKLKSRYTP